MQESVIYTLSKSQAISPGPKQEVKHFSFETEAINKERTVSRSRVNKKTNYFVRLRRRKTK